MRKKPVLRNTSHHSSMAAANAGAVQAAMESIAQGNEPKEELVFNPVTGELEAVTPAVAKASTTKPVMTRIAKDGFFTHPHDRC